MPVMTEPSLLEALGSPSLEALPPLAASAEWTARRNCLRAHLRALGCHAAGVPGRPGRRWPQLAGILLAALVTRLKRPLTWERQLVGNPFFL